MAELEPVVPTSKPAAEDHLTMVPLSAQSDGTYDDGKTKGSSTEFFAIPHANRAKNDSPPPTGRPPPSQPPVAAPAPVMAGPVVAGPMPVGPQPVMGIQGPMAGGMHGGMGSSGYGMVPPDPDNGRTQSYRVFMVVIGLVLMVCAALVVTVLLVVVAVINNNQPEPLPPIVDQAPVRPIQKVDVDTGGGDAPQIKPANKPVASNPKPVAPREPKPQKPAPTEDNGGGPAGTPGRISITVPGDVHVTAFEVSCPSGFRERGKFAAGASTAALDNVPAEDCAITFKGGTINHKFTGRGGRSYTCTKLGSSSLACK
ncbi:MAG: hypothetical protein R3F61_11215 [Myxococcota bacterium]